MSVPCCKFFIHLQVISENFMFSVIHIYIFSFDRIIPLLYFENIFYTRLCLFIAQSKTIYITILNVNLKTL